MSDLVKIICPQCGFGREIPRQHVPATAKTVTCPQCAHRFLLRLTTPKVASTPIVNSPKKKGKPIITFIKYTFLGVALLCVILIGVGAYLNSAKKDSYESSAFISELNSNEKSGKDVLNILIDKLRKEKSEDDQMAVMWLEKRRNNGELPYLYLLGLFNAKCGRVEKGFQYIAAGSLVYRVDSERCGDSTANQAVPIVEMQMGINLIKEKLKQDQKLRNKVVDYALSYEQENKERQRPVWICSHGIKTFTGGSVAPSEEDWENKRQVIRSSFKEKYAVAQ